MIKLPNMFRSLESRNYRIWAAGALVSNIGTWLQRTAQDWLVLTQLTHHSASAVGGVMALQFGPQFLMLPVSGYIADHYNRRCLLMATQGTMGTLSLLLGLLTVTGLVRLWQVDIFAFLFGCAAALDAPVRHTFVVELVGDRHLPNAISLNSTSFNSARLVGPAVAGVVIAGVGTGWAFVLNGVSFVAVLASLNLLRISSLHSAPRPKRQKGGMTEGFRYAWRHEELRTILMMLALTGTFTMNFALFISTMAVRVFHADAAQYGLLSSMMAVGTVTGALLAANRERPTFFYLVGGAAVLGLGCLAAAGAPEYWLFGACLIVTGVAANTFLNSTNGLIQLGTEPGMRGRLMALRMGIAQGGTPIGAPLVGFIADHFGPRWGMVTGAAGGLSAAALGTLLLLRAGHGHFGRGKIQQPGGGQ